MRGDEGVLVNRTPDVAAGEVVANLGRGGEVPLLLAVEGVGVDASGDVDALGQLRNLLEGSLDTVVDVVEQTGTELDGEGLAGAVDRVTDRDAGWETLLSVLVVFVQMEALDAHTCLLVDLNSGLIGIDSNDLADQFVLAHLNLRVVSLRFEELLNKHQHVLVPVRTWPRRSCPRRQ